jgi:hypothetical protein
MWTAISTFVVVLVALLWRACSIGANSHIRAKAQEHPESWIYLYITLFDQVLKATVFRPVQPPSTTAQESVGGSGHADRGSAEKNADRNTAHEHVLIAEYAVQALIDPKLKVPKHAWNLVRLETMMIISLILVVLVGASLQVLIMHFFSQEIAFMIVSIVLFVLVVFVQLSMAMEWGPFNVSMKLHMNPFVLIIATKRAVLLHSSWLPRTQMANRGLAFSASDGRFMSNLFILRDNQPPAIVFSYATYFSPYLSLEGGLPALAERLNRLMEIARNAPELDLENPLFGQLASS